LRGPDVRPQIHVDRLVPVRPGGLEAGHPDNPGVGEVQVDRAELLLRQRDHAANGRRIGHVRAGRDRETR
jgi:hypothetical protein